MITQKLAPRGGKFSTSSSTAVGNDALACNDPCNLGKDYSTAIEMVLGTTHIHPTRLAWVRGKAESQVLWYNAHNIWMGTQMVKLTVLQLVQPIGARSTTGGLINQEARAPPPPSFPHTMLSVKKLKDNMRLAFIEKFFTKLRDRNQRVDKILALQRYVVRKWKLLVWHQLCSATESSSLVSVWQHATWRSARCVEGRAIHREVLSRLQLGEARGWNTYSLSIQIHKKLGNIFVQLCPSPTRALLLSLYRL
jgi:hypothetical protein